MVKRFFSNMGYICIESWFDFMSGKTKDEPTGWSIDFVADCDVDILAGILEDEFTKRGIK